MSHQSLKERFNTSKEELAKLGLEFNSEALSCTTAAGIGCTPLTTSWSMTVVDCATWRVDSFVGIEPNPIAISYDSLADKVYVVSRNILGTVTAVACATNHVVSEMQVGDSPCDALWNPRNGRTYVAVINRSAIAVLCDSTSGVPGRPSSINRQPNRATITRARIMLPASAANSGRRRTALLDATGRKVADLAPGANDVQAPRARRLLRASSVRRIA